LRDNFESGLFAKWAFKDSFLFKIFGEENSFLQQVFEDVEVRFSFIGHMAFQ